jgi:uncharacterized protein (DUF2249 family)
MPHSNGMRRHVVLVPELARPKPDVRCFLFSLKVLAGDGPYASAYCETGRNSETCPANDFQDGNPMFDNAVHPFDARGVAKRFRHAAIFGALESLEDGETMRFVNDHDPLPLLGQIQQRYGNQVGISYVAREPGNIVIDFRIQLGASAEAAPAVGAAAAAGSCGGGHGCGCSGG